jgi:hypothetical protein
VTDDLRSPKRQSKWQRHVGAIGATLGLFATLWATLIGRTVPDLFRPDPVNSFRSRVNEVCRKDTDNIARDGRTTYYATLPRLDRDIKFQAGRFVLRTQSSLADYERIRAPEQFITKYADMLLAIEDIAFSGSYGGGGSDGNWGDGEDADQDGTIEATIMLNGINVRRLTAAATRMQSATAAMGLAECQVLGGAFANAIARDIKSGAIKQLSK